MTVENNAKLEKLLMSDPDMEKVVRKIVKKVILSAQKQLQEYAKGAIGSTKKAEKAVRHAVYKKLLGGNVNILPSRRRAGVRAPIPPVVHKLEHETNRKGNHRGGNRVKRSRQTEDMLTYMGVDRGFILNFLNKGTVKRTSRLGNRGILPASNWFGNASLNEMNKAAGQLEEMIDEQIEILFNEQ